MTLCAMAGATPTCSYTRWRTHSASSAAPSSCPLRSPAGYENYFRGIHRALEAGETLDTARLAELRARYRTQTL